jgi:hypothetical protein
VGNRSGRVNGWCFFLLVDFLASEEGQVASHGHSLLMPLDFKGHSRWVGVFARWLKQKEGLVLCI